MFGPPSRSLSLVTTYKMHVEKYKFYNKFGTFSLSLLGKYIVRKQFAQTICSNISFSLSLYEAQI